MQCLSRIYISGEAKLWLVGTDAPAKIWKTSIRIKFHHVCCLNFHTYKKNTPPSNLF